MKRFDPVGAARWLYQTFDPDRHQRNEFPELEYRASFSVAHAILREHYYGTPIAQFLFMAWHFTKGWPDECRKQLMREAVIRWGTAVLTVKPRAVERLQCLRRSQRMHEVARALEATIPGTREAMRQAAIKHTKRLGLRPPIDPPRGSSPEGVGIVDYCAECGGDVPDTTGVCRRCGKGEKAPPVPAKGLEAACAHCPHPTHGNAPCEAEVAFSLEGICGCHGP